MSGLDAKTPNLPAYSQRAAEIATKVRQEDGVKAACEALESVFKFASSSS